MRMRYLLAGAGIAIVLTAVAVIGAVQEQWWLVVAAGMAMLSITMLVALDADRRVRALRPYIRREVTRNAGSRGKTGKPVPEAPPVSDIDVVGAVRVLQAQYTGRLDRMQTSVDQAIAQLRAADQAPGTTRGSSEQA